MSTTGLLLAAGAGRRMGRPKALVDGWLARAVENLAACDTVVVVLGASAQEARRLLDPYDVTVVVAGDWEDGMGASLTAGLSHVTQGEANRCLVTLVDLPDLTADVVARVLAEPDEAAVLARAAYDGKPGHPVLLGRDHWAGAIGSAASDQGARDYLATHPPVLVECGDLATGEDQDRPLDALVDPNP